MRLKYLAGSMLLLPSISFADITWNGSLGVEKRFTGNPRLTNTDERSDSSNTLNASFGVAVTESRYELTAEYTYDVEDWQNDTFDTNSNLQGTLQGNASLIPSRLNWMAYHNQSLARTESQLPDTPDNTEERTIVATGPTFIQRFSDRSSLEFSSVYSEVQLEESARNDSHRVANSLNWNYLVSSSTSFSANVSRENAIFDVIKLANYSRESAFLQLTGSRPIFDYSIALGANKILPRRGESRTGKYVDVGFSRSFTSSSASLLLTKELTDSVFGAGQVDTGPGSAPVDSLSNLTSIEIIERDVVRLTYSSDLIPDRLQAGISVSYQRDKSEITDGINQENVTAIVNGSYAVSESVSIFSELEWGEETFKESTPERQDEIQRFMIGSSYRIGERLSSSIEVQYRKLDSDAEESNYDEFSSLVRLEYLFGT